MESVKAHNLEPSYITATDAVSSSLTQALIELVDERGKRSEWSYNPDCLEFQIANPFAKVRQPHDEKVSACLAELFGLGESCLRHLNRCFGNNVCDIVTGHHGFWVLRYDQGGSFDMHCDWDSGPNGIRPPIVATACVLLNDDFSGGETLLFNGVEAQTIIKRSKGDIILWDGFTQHKVAPITEGTRYALVIHYTGTIK